MKNIKILIIEDEFIIATNIKLLLQKEGYNICGIANNYESALCICKEKKPDLILSDLFLKNSKSGIQAINDINKQENRQVPVIIITAYSHDDVLDKALKIEPLYFITKPFTEAQIIAAVKLALKTIKSISKENCPSKREVEILKYLAKGFSSKEISEKLCISPNTVETHRKNLMHRYCTNSSAELIFLAATKKWIT